MHKLLALGIIALSVGCSRASPIKAEPESAAAQQQPQPKAPAAPQPVQSAQSVGQESPPVGKEAVRDDAPPPAPNAPPARSGGRLPSDPDAVREATFRYMFGKNASGQQQSAGVYCLELEKGADPSPAFLARLRSAAPHVTRASACDASADKGVIEKSSGKQGLIFRVESISWIDDDHAEVGGGYYEAGLSASGNTYYLERKNGAWHVTKDVMHWIS